MRDYTLILLLRLVYPVDSEQITTTLNLGPECYHNQLLKLKELKKKYKKKALAFQEGTATIFYIYFSPMGKSVLYLIPQPFSLL
jgi:hypothetical protein